MRLALTDPLTGLGNHRHFHDRLERELADSQAQGYPLSLCLVDIDDFKKINDRFGHPAGDKVLAQLATNLRQGGEAFRLGGDEFAILLPGRDEEGARIAAESIIERISVADLPPAGPVTVSAGIATAPARRCRPRRARPARRQRPLLGEGIRQEPDARVPAGRGRDRGAEAARRRPRPRRPLPRRREPREGRRRPRRLHRLALGACLRPRRPDRGAARRRPRADRADASRRPACTTSASSRSRRRSCASLARSPRPSGSCSSATRRSATGCSRASASTPSPTGSSITTSAGTARAIPTPSAARRSRSALGSSSSPTPTTR